MQIRLELGGYRVLLNEPADRLCVHWPNFRFSQFPWQDVHASPDITVHVEMVRTLPDEPARGQIFDAGIGSWRLYRDGDEYVLFSARAETGEPFMHARLSPDFATARARVIETFEPGVTEPSWSPPTLINPLVELMLQERLAHDGGALLHSAAVVVDGEVLVFFGPSGAGKSTSAGLFLAQGYTVLSDERVIIRRQGADITAYGTPWPGSSDLFTAAQGRLRQIFAIGRPAESHTVTAIPAREMIAQLMQESHLPHWDADGLASMVKFFEEIAGRFGCRQLSFRKTPDLVEFLRAYDAPAAVR